MTRNIVSAVAVVVTILSAAPGAAGHTGQAAAPGAGQARAIALPATIPLFPLPDATLFPDISRRLVIFEPRYRRMLLDAMHTDRIIGMVTLRPGFEADYEGRPPIYQIGCAGLITEASELPNGQIAIVLEGFVKFRVTDEDRSRVYRLATVEAIPETLSDEDRASLRALRPSLERLLVSIREPGAATTISNLDDIELVNGLSEYLDLEAGIHQRLLEQEGPLARTRTLLEIVGVSTTPPR